MGKKPDRVTLAPPAVFLAWQMALQYTAAGRDRYNQFAEPLRPDDGHSSLVGLKREATEVALVAATLLSFGIELKLKVAAAQESGGHLCRHELDVLFGDLRADRQEFIASHYNDARDRSHPSAFSLELFIGPVPQAPRGPAGQEDFSIALASSAKLFVELRYLHERFKPEFSQRIDFHWLLRIDNAVSDAIAKYKGSVVTSWGSMKLTRQPPA